MIFTDSAFYYGIVVDADNRVISFQDGPSEIIALLSPGRYTVTQYLTEIISAMNVAGSQAYAGSIDRTTRLITISAPGNFTLKVATSSLSNTAFFDMGFGGADRTGSNSYTGTLGIGFSYRPQFRLQAFVASKDVQRSVEATVNRAAGGQVELIRFGVDYLMECAIDFITEIDQGSGAPIRTNLNGLEDARNFMEYACTKGPLEFIPDVTDPDEFQTFLLESTPESRDGVDFKLKEQFMRGLTGYYSTGLLIFREVQ